MQVTSILTALAGSFANLARGSTAEGPGETPKVEQSSGAQGSAQLEESESVRDVLAQHDVRRISPRDFSLLIRQLREGGHISTSDARELENIRAKLDLELADPDEPVDLLAHFRQKLAQRQLAPPPTGPRDGESLAREVDWLEKFALLHTSAFEPFNSLA